MTDSPHLALPIGDPAGIGPEVMLKALSAMRQTEDGLSLRLTLVGHRSVLEQTYQQLQAQPTHTQAQSLPLIPPAELDILEPDLPFAVDAIQPGNETAASGAASFAYLNRAIDLCLTGTCQGIVTAPISKTAWQLAGHHYPGQTELLAERAGVVRYGMMFVARSPHNGYELRTLLATTHIPLAAVPTALTPDLMTWKLELLIHTLQTQFGIANPMIAIAGLNPHSGENGHLGREEADWLTPWLHTAQARYPHVKLQGLIPPDTLWVNPGQAWFAPPTMNPSSASYRESAYRADHNLSCDAYFALYHDQGLIPVKLLAFDRAVNTTIGLPFIRTSPDHGTAFNIAGRGVADASSTLAALNLAIHLAQTMRQNDVQPTLANP